jgi:Spy/CpxP family protein refolding chaperone
MKRWIKRTLIAVLGFTAVFGGIAAWAHNHHGHGWRAMSEQDAAAMKAKVIEKVGSKLDLDATQKAKLGVLADKLREQRNALVGSTTDPRAEMQALIAGPAFDRARASALIEAKVGAVNAKSPEVLNAAADFFDSLRPDQQAKVREFLASRGHRGPRG